MAFSKKSLLLLAVVSLLFITATARRVCAQDEPPRVITQVTPNRVYEGRPVVYRVILRNIEQQEPQLDGFDDFDVPEAFAVARAPLSSMLFPNWSTL